jgi:dihydroorotate dehydrogenase
LNPNPTGFEKTQDDWVVIAMGLQERRHDALMVWTGKQSKRGTYKSQVFLVVNAYINYIMGFINI